MKHKFVTLSNWEIDTKNRAIVVYSNSNGKICTKRYYIDEYEINDKEFRICSSFCSKLMDLEETNIEWKDCNYILKCNIETHAFIEKGKIYIRTYFTPQYNYKFANISGTYKNVVNKLNSTGASKNN